MRNRSLLCSRRLVAAAALATLLAACGKDKPVPHAAGPVEVGVVTVAAQNLPVAVELPGRVNPVRVAQVRARAAGIVLKKQFVEGSEVKAGQPLFQIDPAPLQATLDSARAAAAKAQATLAQAALQEARYRDLVPINAVSKQDYDNAVIAVKQSEADLASARAAVRTAELNLGYTKVNSPIDGRIGAAQVTEGALVGQGDATLMATVTQLDPIYVDVTQASTQILALRRAMQAGQLQGVDGKAAQVHLVLDDGTVYPLPGRFKFSDITVDQTTGSVSLRAEFPNPNKDLLPGDSLSQLAHSTHLSTMIAREWGHIHVALADGGIVGAVGVNPAGVIWMLYVLPGYQGCGVGSALYEAAIGTLKQAGRRKALLEVLAANESAVAFYRSRGWVPEGRRTEHIPGFRFTAVRMGLALAWPHARRWRRLIIAAGFLLGPFVGRLLFGASYTLDALGLAALIGSGLFSLLLVLAITSVARDQHEPELPLQHSRQ